MMQTMHKKIYISRLLAVILLSFYFKFVVSLVITSMHNNYLLKQGTTTLTEQQMKDEFTSRNVYQGGDIMPYFTGK
jgi:hypothetical protein